MKKKIIIITLAFIAILLTTVLILNLKKDTKTQITNYLSNIGFDKYGNSFLYIKQTSENNLEDYNKDIEQNIETEYEVLYFNVDTFELTKDKMTYNDGITKNFTPTFNYSNDNLTYTYRIKYNNSNIIMEGTYYIETKYFTCKPAFSHQMDIEKTKKAICNKIELEMKIFEYEINTLIENPKLLNNMKEKN